MKKEQTQKEIYLDPKTSHEEKLDIMCNEVYEAFGLKSRWDNVSFDDEPTRYEVTNYDFYLNSFVSQVENKEENYIEYLKCYLRVLSDGFFYGEEIPEEYEFIKQKCREAGIEDIYTRYVVSKRI
ncbi:MAG: hypothetical protein PHQ22_09065 [Sulfuricurvum sp.]|nr:hypothetical protein [Sulfuricurvum sp.]